MASLSRDSSGNYTIQVVCKDGKRRSIRLGSVNKKTASEVKLKVEHLNALHVSGLPMDTETASWVAKIGDDLAAKLAAVGLIPERTSAMLGQFLDDYLQRRKSDSKGATCTHLQTVCNDLRRYFGESQSLRGITVGHADEFRTHYLTRAPKLAAATAARRLTAVRTIFKHALRMKLIDSNPFHGVIVRSVNPPERKAYISKADTERILSACNPTWRIIVALSRYAGLRNPSEVLSLKWEHVNFETGRMTVPSCKTEHLPGKAYRVVPIFPELRPYLDDAFEIAGEGEVYVVGGTQGDGYREAANKPSGWENINLRTQFLKIIRRAGLQPWPRLFHNLRASCETDLMAAHPIHVVTSWLGNTPTVALKHYLQVLDTDFEKAIQKAETGGAESGAVVVQNAVQSGTANDGQKMTKTPETLTDKDFRRLESSSGSSCPNGSLGVTGLEPVTPTMSMWYSSQLS